MVDGAGTAQRAIEAVWRIEAGRLVAGLARVTGDVGLAEELAQDALVVALEQWPVSGIPPNPAGWLMTTAKNRGIDAARRRGTYQRKLEEIGRDQELSTGGRGDDLEDALDDDIGDDLLRLLFTACHPVLSVESRVALTLRCLGGLTTSEIARGFLIPEKTAGQRISRAKKTLTDNGVVFAMPDAAERAARLGSVLEVVYLIFNEGYAAHAGDDWMRPALCQEALRLARLLATLVPDDPEVHGFAALLELQASRIPARTTADGDPVLLLDQDRRRWDRTLLRRGLESLARAEQLASAPGTDAPALGAYAIQAEIAACHARAATPAETDWRRISALYVLLRHAWPSPVVELNRAVAVGFAEGPERGLAVVDAIAGTPALASYPQLPAVRADLLARLGRTAEARESYEAAAALSGNAREREVYAAKARATG
ncbi:RNA polymerase sigma factor [Mumia sp. Pv 4-285]|uniref:RNA polymerase sigma factor n=1 Tax=Mumia qirimensis TaxID=3234852 RepID=UPI00351D51EF